MTDIRFYHLERQSLQQVLPALLSKALSGGHKIVVKAANDKQVEDINAYLWTYNPNSFLPHGSKKDGYAENQPIWLTAEDENPNGASVLILTEGASSDLYEAFDMCCEMLNGHDDEAVSDARTRWKAYKEQGHDVTYWQQTKSGWDKKAG